MTYASALIDVDIVASEPQLPGDYA
jgi:hypothetical protein